MQSKEPKVLQQMAKRIKQRLFAGSVNAIPPSETSSQGSLPLTSKPLVSPPVPGFAPPLSPSLTPEDPSLSKQARTLEALFGRLSLGVGVTQTRYSTISGQLSPESISGAIHLANQGQPFQFADLCEMVIEKDAHLGGVIEQRISGIIGKPDRLEPVEHFQGDSLAISIANFMAAVKEQIDNWDDARFGLLFADGVGYAGAENIYNYKTICWTDGEGRKRSNTYLLPTSIEIVHPKHFVFHPTTGEPMLWLKGSYLKLPPGKFVFHRCFGFSSLSERRGFMRACLWLHAMKHWSLRDMSIYLHLYGIPQMIAEYDDNRMSYEEARKLTELLLQQWGQGKVITNDKALDVRELSSAPNGALIHRDAAQFLNGEMSKRVLYSNLTVDSSGGPGSYGLGGIHENAAFDGKLLSAMKLCSTLRNQVFQPTLELNAKALANELSASPADILSRLCAYTSRIERETGMERANIYALAGKVGVKTSIAQFRHDMHLNAPKDKEDILGGEAVPVPSGGKVVSSVEATQGVEAPKPRRHDE